MQLSAIKFDRFFRPSASSPLAQVVNAEGNEVLAKMARCPQFLSIAKRKAMVERLQEQLVRLRPRSKAPALGALWIFRAQNYLDRSAFSERTKKETPCLKQVPLDVLGCSWLLVLDFVEASSKGCHHWTKRRDMDIMDVSCCVHSVRS